MWVRIDENAMDHPKMVRAGRDGYLLWMAGICYSSRHLTDGRVPSEALQRLAGQAWLCPDSVTEVAERLVTVGLWERTEDGYLVHDYLDYNPSADDVRGMRERDRERKRRGRQSQTRDEAGRFAARSDATDTVTVPCPGGIRAESARNPRGIQEDSERIPPVYANDTYTLINQGGV